MKNQKKHQFITRKTTSTLNNHKTQNAQRSFLTTLGVVLIILICVFTTQKSAYAGINDGLIAHYLFDGDLTTIGSDSSGNNHHGSPEYLIIPTEGVAGANNTAAEIGYPSTARIKVNPHPDFDILPEAQISVVFWMKSDGGSDSIIRSLGSRRVGYNFGCYGGRYTVELNSRYNELVKFQGSSIITDVWTHVAFVVDRSLQTGNCKIYVNNVLDSSGDVFFPLKHKKISCASEISIGHPNTGKIDNLRIYNRAISESEIDELYNLRGEYYIDFVDSIGGIYDTDNSGSDEVALLKGTYQGIQVVIKNQDDGTSATSTPITGFFSSATGLVEDWSPLSIMLTENSNGEQLLGVVAKNKTIDKVKISYYNLANGTIELDSEDMPLYDYTN